MVPPFPEAPDAKKLIVMKLAPGRMAILLFFLTLTACARHLSHSDVEKQLKKAMLHSLETAKGYDPAKMKFEVMDVTYFEDPAFYICDFQVRLHQNGGDTTGIMHGTVSKDFNTVHRNF